MLIILGVLVALAPFYGIPMSILAFILPVLGLVVAAIGISLRAGRPASARPAPPSHEATEAASA